MLVLTKSAGRRKVKRLSASIVRQSFVAVWACAGKKPASSNDAISKRRIIRHPKYVCRIILRQMLTQAVKVASAIVQVARLTKMKRGSLLSNSIWDSQSKAHLLGRSDRRNFDFD